MENNLKVILECIDCKNSFEADATNIKNMNVTCDGNTFGLIYVDCPSCGRRHYVQIDSDETNKLKVQNLIMFKKLSKKKLSGKNISSLENKTFKGLREKLLDLRTELMKEYEGRIVTDTITGESVTLHFTFC